MKKIICILAIIAIVCMTAISATAVSSPTPKSYYQIELSVRGTGEATSSTNTVEVGTDDTCTFTAKETSEKFVFWNISGDYDIVSGDYEELVFTIRPKSDIQVFATFDDGVLEHAVPAEKSLTSPKTGDYTSQVVATSMSISGIALLILIIYAIRKRNQHE